MSGPPTGGVRGVVSRGMRAVASLVAKVARQFRRVPPVPPPVQVSGGRLVTYLDVGDTLRAHYRAGIQRVVCALVAELPAADPGIELVPVLWCGRNGTFRRATEAEAAALRRRAGALPEAVPEPERVARAKEALRRALGALGVLAAVRRARVAFFGRHLRAVEDSLLLGEPCPGAVWLEVDAVWNDARVDRGELLGSLRRTGVHVASFIHDLLPIEHPGWFVPALRAAFGPTAREQLRHSELLLCASEATREQIRRVCAAEGIAVPATEVVPLGATVPEPEPEPHAAPPDPAGQDAAVPDPVGRIVGAGPYLLVVGTLEPRKNHRLALDVFDRLAPDHPGLQLVFAGRHGWGVEELVGRVRGHPAFGTTLHWLDDVHDEVLDVLYRAAFAVLVPSTTEGFGLPVVEALARGVPVVASAGGALPEAGGDAADYADPDDVGAWVAVVERQLADPAAHAGAVARARGFAGSARGWAESAAAICQALRGRFGTGAPPGRPGGT